MVKSANRFTLLASQSIRAEVIEFTVGGLKLGLTMRRKRTNWQDVVGPRRNEEWTGSAHRTDGPRTFFTDVGGPCPCADHAESSWSEAVVSVDARTWR